MFPLCVKCAEEGSSVCNHADRSFVGTWCTPELKIALEKGYTIMDIYEVWHFDKKGDRLFKGYMQDFLKIKQEASGYPGWCKTDEDRQKYIEHYHEKQGILLDATKIRKNEGLRSAAKLMWSSLWGKFGQKNNQEKHMIINVNSNPGDYYNIMFNPKYKVHDIIDFENGTSLELRYSLEEKL